MIRLSPPLISPARLGTSLAVEILCMRRKKFLSLMIGNERGHILMKAFEIIGWLVAILLFVFAGRAAFA
jgi:hypothetical protein